MTDATIPDSPYRKRPQKHPLPSNKSLHERFRYDPETGAITRNRPGSKLHNKRADFPTGSGYRRVNLKQNKYIQAHQLAFALSHGHIPPILDHINRDKGDNRLKNLRPISHRGNLTNRKSKNISRMPSKHGQGFYWVITTGSQRSGTLQKAARRDFCAAWHLRKQWLATRATKLGTALTGDGNPSRH